MQLLNLINENLTLATISIQADARKNIFPLPIPENLVESIRALIWEYAGVIESSESMNTLQLRCYWFGEDAQENCRRAIKSCLDIQAETLESHPEHRITAAVDFRRGSVDATLFRDLHRSALQINQIAHTNGIALLVSESTHQTIAHEIPMKELENLIRYSEQSDAALFAPVQQSSPLPLPERSEMIEKTINLSQMMLEASQQRKPRVIVSSRWSSRFTRSHDLA